MNDVFRGRTAELNALNKKFKQNGFVMTVLYGRRRVGKTRLINEFMQGHDCKKIYFTCVEREESELLSLMTSVYMGWKVASTFPSLFSILVTIYGAHLMPLLAKVV